MLHTARSVLGGCSGGQGRPGNAHGSLLESDSLVSDLGSAYGDYAGIGAESAQQSYFPLHVAFTGSNELTPACAPNKQQQLGLIRFVLDLIA